MRNSWFILLLIIVLQSCYYDKEEELYGPVLCDIIDVSYATDVEPIINSSCATSGCHVAGGSGPGNFTNFNELEAKVANGSFENRVINQRTMPPGTQLQDCELQILQVWIDNGALNN